MRATNYLVYLMAVLVTACSLTQKPASVSDAGEASTQAVVSPQPVEQPVVVPAKHVAQPETLATKQALSLTAIAGIAKSAQKNPQSVKKYAGESLAGQAKFIKAPKGNPNAVVADVRVTGLGEVSLWCRNVLGAAPANKVVSFEGVLTGSVYTSEDFSHDVTMKDCRFHE